MVRLELHPDRALPADPVTRAVARRIYASTSALPLVCMHGHIDAAVLAADAALGDPAQLLVVPDHYVTRLLMSQGLTPGELGLQRMDSATTESDSRDVWRRFCSHWHVFRGTPSRFWLEHELVEIFGIDVQPSAETADALFDRMSARLAEPEMRPRALLDRFRIDVLATTDSATSSLAQHERLARDGFADRVIPTFRPDALLHVDRPNWFARVCDLGGLTGVDIESLAGFLEALRVRRRQFVEIGALATDHGHLRADCAPLSAADAATAYAAALAGRIDAGSAAALAGHLLFEMAAMSCEDGLVMQLHVGVLRDHDPGFRDAYGSDRGFDIPAATEFTRALRPILSRFGRDPRFRLVLFTVDESAYSRELAPIAGAYSAVRLGAPWWFLDSPDGMRRFRELVTETAGFYNTTGFVDDTRAFLSIPARHDLARRIDAGYLARLVVEHRLGEDEAIETAVDMADRLPRESYSRRNP